MSVSNRLLLVCLACLTAVARGANPAPAGPARPNLEAPAADLSGPWTFSRALQRALDANADILEAKYDLEREAGVRLQVQSRLLPRLTLTGSADERDEGLIDRSPGEFSAPATLRQAIAESSYEARVELRQVLYDSLGVWNQVKRQKVIEKRSYLALADTTNRTVSLVRQGFDAILARHQVLEGERRRIRDLTQLAELTERKQAVGEIAELDALRVKSELESARAELADSERGLIVAEQAFCRLLQLEIGQPLVLEGRLQEREFGLTFDKARALAMKHRPDLEAAGLAVLAARLQQRSQLSEYLPKFEFYASYGTRTSYYDYDRRLDGWTVGAVGQWNLFDGGDRRGRRVSQRAELRAAETRQAEIENSVLSHLRELFQTLDQTRAAIAAQESSVQYATRALRQARQLYEAGQVSVEQVLQAEMAARRAEVRQLETILNHNVAISQIEYSVGAGVAGLPAE